MDWETIFSLANGFAMIAWIVLLLAPRREWLFTLLRDGAVGLLCLAYAAILIYLMFFATGGGDEGGPDFTTLQGVMALFATEGGTTVGWIHYLAFDLFAGLWVARNADEIALSRIVQVPILLATFLFGPVGLLIFLIVRRIHMARSPA
ncbi:ABA4-like family protein [uncultured Parasphingopyxis sp.]|uniref:ABA4-like family protein n=2 Tax=Parasphingopyxis TaxID=1234545 RepID=UPI0026290B44|nr:ABA4-like family protein [uncultured Parasphingopyxis sp.]